MMSWDSMMGSDRKQFNYYGIFKWVKPLHIIGVIAYWKTWSECVQKIHLMVPMYGQHYHRSCKLVWLKILGQQPSTVATFVVLARSN